MIESKEIENKALEIIAEKFKTKASDLKPSSHIVDDLGADSLEVVELIMDFEAAFDIVIPDKEAEKLKTVGAIIEYLKAGLSD